MTPACSTEYRAVQQYDMIEQKLLVQPATDCRHCCCSSMVVAVGTLLWPGRSLCLQQKRFCATNDFPSWVLRLAFDATAVQYEYNASTLLHRLLLHLGVVYYHTIPYNTVDVTRASNIAITAVTFAGVVQQGSGPLSATTNDLPATSIHLAVPDVVCFLFTYADSRGL